MVTVTQSLARRLTWAARRTTLNVDDRLVPGSRYEKLNQGISVRAFSGFEAQARERLRRLDAATSLNDLAAIPGNRLEALRRRRLGRHSIRVNNQWRICFVWKNGAAYDVEIVDHH